MTVNPREALLAVRGRQTQTALDAAARTAIARKGFPFHDAQPGGYPGDDPKPAALKRVSTLITPPDVHHRTIYHEETGPI